MKAEIFITPKKGILDPQGLAVGKSLRSIGFDQAVDVKVGKFIEITMNDVKSNKDAEEIVDNMCRKLLVNSIIEDYEFTIKADKS